MDASGIVKYNSRARHQEHYHGAYAPNISTIQETIANQQKTWFGTSLGWALTSIMSILAAQGFAYLMLLLYMLGLSKMQPIVFYSGRVDARYPQN
eukprot:5759587-Amphidinium_carterae.2